MPWNHNTAQNRIRKKIDDAPNVNVRNFKDDYYPVFWDNQKTALERKIEASNKPLFDLPSDNAILVNTVQMYINITNYEDYRLVEGLETEASHENALKFLHFHYSTCDRVVENTNAQRVDFHSARMHAVLLEDIKTGITAASVMEAIHIAKQIESLADLANNSLAGGNLNAKFRVGIDIGKCVAINSGNGKDSEPLFLGGAANHAAKLAAGDREGIYLSDDARSLLDMRKVFGLANERANAVSEIDYRRLSEERPFASTLGEYSLASERAQTLLMTWNDEILNKEVKAPAVPSFSFHHKTPPLSDLDYDTLYPSNSIRMPVSSFYADLDGYTAYVDNAMVAEQVQEAVTVIHVMRSELQSVLEEDFGGRKVRFIGDCIHGVLAEGNAASTDVGKTADISFECTGALRSSFKICQQLLGNCETLGLAIGVELGETPVSRIGIRGERGVRVASSTATIASEELQSSCDGDQTRFGSLLMREVSIALEDLTDEEGYVTDLVYSDVSDLIGLAAPAIHRSHCGFQ